MAQYTINGFARGMDTRRPPWAAPASSLQLAKDVVLNSSGDVEVRKAFVAKYMLPANTYGLRDVEDELVVFGTAAAPGVPAGVTYQQITSSDGAHIETILSSDLYDGKVYLSALMSDASVRHYYDGVEVDDWFDGRARSSFDVTGGTSGGVTRIDVDGVDVLGATVNWVTSHVATAAAIAAQINTYVSVPNYEAVSIGATVVIKAASGSGATPNGYAVAVTVTTTTTVSTPGAMASGVTNAPEPGSYVCTHDGKMYSPAGPLLNFSSIDGPTQWNTEYDGAGFSDLSRTKSGSETLMSVGAFLEEMAVFARKCIQLWHVEADDTENRRIQTFNDVGLDAPRAQCEFRSTDRLFLDPYRGVLAIVPSASEQQFARIEEVGLPIAKFLTAYKKTLSAAVVERALMFVEPSGPDGAYFWAVIGERVFVYSWHLDDEIAGWTYFEPGFQIEDAAVVSGRLYVRAGNTIYLYGGDDDDEYPAADVGVMQFAAFRMSAPERVKAFKGLDYGVEGEWEARLFASARDTVGRTIHQPTQETFEDLDAAVFEMGANPILQLTRKSTGYARVCQLVVNYTPVHSG